MHKKGGGVVLKSRQKGGSRLLRLKQPDILYKHLFIWCWSHLIISAWGVIPGQQETFSVLYCYIHLIL